MSKKLVIRFDGPPGHESGRFIEVELDGTSINYGEWEQDGDDWLLVLPDADARVAQLEAKNERLWQEREIIVGYLATTLMRENKKDVKAIGGE